MSGLVAGPVVRIAIMIGDSAPSPNAPTRRSYATREGTLAGRIVASGALNRTPRNGTPSRTSRPSVGTRTATGRAMTRRARRAQGPSWPDAAVTRLTGSRSMPGPTTPRRAGSNVRAAATATATTTAPAMPTERRIMNRNSVSPISPRRTVRPEKNTARPAVATVTRTASATALARASSRSSFVRTSRHDDRRASSSRKRLVSRSE